MNEPNTETTDENSGLELVNAEADGDPPTGSNPDLSITEPEPIPTSDSDMITDLDPQVHFPETVVSVEDDQVEFKRRRSSHLSNLGAKTEIKVDTKRYRKLLYQLVAVAILAVAGLAYGLYYYKQFGYPPTTYSQEAYYCTMIALMLVLIILRSGFYILKMGVTNMFVGMGYMVLLVVCLFFPAKAIRNSILSLTYDNTMSIKYFAKHPNTPDLLHPYWESIQRKYECCGTREIDRVNDWSNILKSSNMPASCCTKPYLEKLKRERHLTEDSGDKQKVTNLRESCGKGLARTRNLGENFRPFRVFSRIFSGFQLSLTEVELEAMKDKFSATIHPERFLVDKYDIVAGEIKSMRATKAFLQIWKSYYMDHVCNSVDYGRYLSYTKIGLPLPPYRGTADKDGLIPCEELTKENQSDLIYPGDWNIKSSAESIGWISGPEQALTKCKAIQEKIHDLREQHLPVIFFEDIVVQGIYKGTKKREYYDKYIRKIKGADCTTCKDCKECEVKKLEIPDSDLDKWKEKIDDLDLGKYTNNNSYYFELLKEEYNLSSRPNTIRQVKRCIHPRREIELAVKEELAKEDVVKVPPWPTTDENCGWLWTPDLSEEDFPVIFYEDIVVQGIFKRDSKKGYYDKYVEKIKKEELNDPATDRDNWEKRIDDLDEEKYAEKYFEKLKQVYMLKIRPETSEEVKTCIHPKRRIDLAIELELAKEDEIPLWPTDKKCENLRAPDLSEEDLPVIFYKDHVVVQGIYKGDTKTRYYDMYIAKVENEELVEELGDPATNRSNWEEHVNALDEKKYTENYFEKLKEIYGLSVLPKTSEEVKTCIHPRRAIELAIAQKLARKDTVIPAWPMNNICKTLGVPLGRKRRDSIPDATESNEGHDKEFGSGGWLLNDTPASSCSKSYPKFRRNATTLGRELLLVLDYLTSYIYEMAQVEGKKGEEVKLPEKGSPVIWPVPTRGHKNERLPFKLAANLDRIPKGADEKLANKLAKKMYYMSRGITENLILDNIIHDRTCASLDAESIPDIRHKLAHDVNKRFRLWGPEVKWRNPDEALGNWFHSFLRDLAITCICASILVIFSVIVVTYVFWKYYDRIKHEQYEDLKLPKEFQDKDIPGEVASTRRNTKVVFDEESGPVSESKPESDSEVEEIKRKLNLLKLLENKK